MKKIKKENPVPPKKFETTNDMLDFIRAESKEAPPREKAVNYKTIPSKRPEFIRWRKKDSKDWNMFDFIGYYLSKYIEYFKEEDPDFKKVNSYIFGKERGQVNNCLKTVFSEDKEKMKEYIDFILPWWVSEESWVTDLPSFGAIFTTKGAFYRAFVSAKNAPPKKNNRQQADNHAASWESWKDFEEE